jgi:hypothetical protein
MKLGKRERQARREAMRAAEARRARIARAENPGIDAAACNGRVGSCVADLWPSAAARPRVPAGWNSHEARRSSHLLGKVYA